MGLDKICFQGNRLLVRSNSFLISAKGLQGISQVVIGISIVRIKFECSADKLHSNIRFTHLMSQNPKIMICLNIVRITLENITVQLLSLRQLPSPMIFQGFC